MIAIMSNRIQYQDAQPKIISQQNSGLWKKLILKKGNTSCCGELKADSFAVIVFPFRNTERWRYYLSLNAAMNVSAKLLMVTKRVICNRQVMVCTQQIPRETLTGLFLWLLRHLNSVLAPSVSLTETIPKAAISSTFMFLFVVSLSLCSVSLCIFRVLCWFSES